MRILIFLMILTLSSCVVSSKLYDEQVAKNAELLEQMKSDKATYDFQDELCRSVEYELKLELDSCKAKSDTLKWLNWKTY